MSYDQELRRSEPEPEQELPEELANEVAPTTSNRAQVDSLPPAPPTTTPTLDLAAGDTAPPPVSEGLTTALATRTEDGALDVDAVAAALTPLYSLDIDDRERFAAEVPALYESLSPEQRRLLAETMVEQGRAFETAYYEDGGKDIEQDPGFQQVAAIQGAWADHTAALGVDPYGEDIDISISTTGEDYKRYRAEIDAFREEQELAGNHVWSDMWLPYTMWSREGNIDRYRNTHNVTWVGEEGLRVYNYDWRDQSFAGDAVTVDEREVATTVEQRGDGVIETDDGTVVQTHMGFNKLPGGSFGDAGWATVPQRPQEVEAQEPAVQMPLWTEDEDGNLVPNVAPQDTTPAADTDVAAAADAADTEVTAGGEFENGAFTYERQHGLSQFEAGIDGNFTAGGTLPVGVGPLVAGGNVAFEDGQLTAAGTGGIRVPVGDDHLSALGYGSVTFGPDGSVESFGAGGSAELGEWGASVAVSFVDRDFASYVPAGDGNPAMVLYGQTNSSSISGGATVPVGPFVVGADGHVSRSQTTQAFAAADTLTGLDPDLARTDPQAYRDAVAAVMGERTRDIDSPDDLDADVIAGWGPDAGITIEQRVGDGVGGTFGLGPVSVEGGVEGSRIEQTTITNLEDGAGFEVTVTSIDEEAFRAGLNGGPLGIGARDSDTTSSSVTFTIDDADALQEYLETGVLPGAQAYAETVGLAEAGATLTDEQQAAQAAEWNRAYLMAQQNGESGPVVDEHTQYTDIAFSEAFRQDTSLSVLGFDVLNQFHEERNTEKLYNVDGAWETNLLYDQAESWMFSRDSHQSGISVNPESGAFVGMYASMDANSDWIAQNGLTDLLDPNDPYTQLWASGALWAEGTPRLSLGVGFGEDELAAIDAELEASGPADERFAALDENIDNRMMNFLGDNSDFEYTVDPATGDIVVTNVPTDVAIDNLAPYAGITPEEATAMFGDHADDPAYVVQTLVDVMNASPSDFAELDPLQQELYLRIGLNSYGPDDPHFAETEGNPFEMLDLIADVEDPEVRDAMIRRTFYAAESQQEGAQGALMFLQFADGLSPELRDRLRDGAVVQVDGEVEPLNLMFDEFASGQTSMRIGSASTVAMLEDMTPEQRTMFFENLPDLANLEETRRQWEETNPGQPWPFDGVDPASMVFSMAGDPWHQAGILAAAEGTPYYDQVVATAAAQFAGQDPAAILAEYAYDPESYTQVLDLLEAAGFDRSAMTVGVLTATGEYDPTQANTWLAGMDATAAGDWARDQEQSHNLLGAWTPGTWQMTAALVSVQGDPAAAAAFVDGYLAEAGSDTNGGDTVTNMLDAFGGNAAQVQLAMDVLRAAGRGAEVDAWLADQ